jgi:hypothetical protein
MTVKKLKEILSQMPEDREILIKCSVAEYSSPITGHLTATVKRLDKEIGNFFGLPVMGGTEKKVVILTD